MSLTYHINLTLVTALVNLVDGMYVHTSSRISAVISLIFMDLYFPSFLMVDIGVSLVAPLHQRWSNQKLSSSNVNSFVCLVHLCMVG